jgi:hypothetical protein
MEDFGSLKRASSLSLMAETRVKGRRKREDSHQAFVMEAAVNRENQNIAEVEQARYEKSRNDWE